MANWGFRSRNANGIVQIDRNHKNFAVSTRGVAVSNAEVGVADFGFYPHVFVKPIPGYELCPRPYNPGRNPRNSFAFRVYSGNAHVVGAQYEYAVCSPTPGATRATQWGLRVRHPDGGVAYDSRWVMPRIAVGLRFDGRSGYPTIVLPDSSQDWFVSMPRGPIRYDWDDGQGGSNFALCDMVSVRYGSANTLVFAQKPLPDEFLPSRATPGLNPAWATQLPLNLVVLIAKLR